MRQISRTIIKADKRRSWWGGGNKSKRGTHRACYVCQASGANNRAGTCWKRECRDQMSKNIDQGSTL